MLFRSQQILRCEHIISAVPYQVKAKAVYDTIHHEVSELVPATVLKTHPDVQLFIDMDSASLLGPNVPERIS